MAETIRTTAALLALLPSGSNSVSAETIRDVLVSLQAKSGWLDYNDLATASAPITVTGGGGDVQLTNDGAGAFTNKAYPPGLVTDIYDVVGDEFDWSELSLGDMVDIRLDVSLIIASVNTEVNIDLHLGTGGGAYTIPFLDAKNFKSTGTYKELRFIGIYMGDVNTLGNNGKFMINADKTLTVTVNGWYCKVIKYTG